MTTKHHATSLHRSSTDRLLCGVCGGLAEYFEVDSTIVRIGFVVAALIPPFAPVSLIGYPVLCLLLPVAGSEHLEVRDRVRSNISGFSTDLREVGAEVRASVASFGKGRRPVSPADAETPEADPSEMEPSNATTPDKAESSASSSVRAA